MFIRKGELGRVAVAHMRKLWETRGNAVIMDKFAHTLMLLREIQCSGSGTRPRFNKHQFLLTYH